MLTSAISILLIAYLPGAVIFRLPVAHIEQRAALSVEERIFWHVVLSLTLSSFTALALAALGSYQLSSLLWINGILTITPVIAWRSKLRLPPTTRGLKWTTVVPVAIAGLTLWIVFYVPPAEYVMGGKDPGTYMNEGIQIAQRGTLTVTEPLIASVPTDLQDLFFSEHEDPEYRRYSYGNRFMGFFLLDPEKGTVVGQFPHVYPLWIAIGYEINGLSGARYVLGLWAVLGVLAVYFAGIWLIGRPAAALGAMLLAVHVGQVWYSRYPNAEILAQVFLFAGLLGFSRASVENNRFFAPIAALLATIGFLTHITGVFVIIALASASVLGVLDQRKPQAAFLLPLIIGTGIAVLYYETILTPYIAMPLEQYRRLPGPQYAPVVIGVTLIIGALWIAKHERVRLKVRQSLPWIFTVTLLSLTTYAYFFRMPGPGLAVHDAEALRVFAEFYLSPIGLIVSLVGLAVVAHRSFWPGIAYMLTMGLMSCFLFYKMRVIPEHFWALRRMIPVILPTTLLLISVAAFFPSSLGVWMRLNKIGRTLLYGLGIIIVIAFGQRYFASTQAILNHVEYAGLIPHLETLADRFNDTDLIIVESRQSSDMHVLALPLAYTYAKHTLVLSSPEPSTQSFNRFLQWAKGRYKRIFFVGGGGTEVLSSSMRVIPVASERFQIPEYEQAFRAYPTHVRFKEFDFGIYELRPERVNWEGLDLDVGIMDDLFVRRFHAKEQRGGSGLNFRWTRDISIVSLLGVGPEHRILTLWLSDGGRPAGLPPATAELFIDDRPLGTVTANAELQPYRFNIPLEIAEELSARDEAGRLRIESSTWNPLETLGLPDNRDLGLMVDRITVE